MMATDAWPASITRLGLKFLPHGGAHPLAWAVAAGLAFGAYMAIADALVFRSVIPAAQTELVSGFPTLQRIAYFVPMAVVDELEFRSVLMSALVWVFVTIAGLRRASFWAAIVCVALVAYPAFHQTYLASLAPVTPLAISRELLLHGAPGVLWGYLYWRHGLLAAIAGHASAHLSLQPMLGLLFP